LAIAAIRLFGDRCLRRRAAAVSPSDSRTGDLLDTLWDSLSADGGVGLAAPQIGVPQRVIVIRDPGRPEGQQRLDLVNPVIRRTFGPEEFFSEGCLSFPGLYIDIRRRQGIELEYMVPSSGERWLKLRDRKLLARIIQHEVDHLDGVLFIDHLRAVDRWLLGPRLLWIMGRRLWRRMGIPE